MFEKLEEEIEVKADEYALEESTACNYGESSKHVYQGYFYGFKKGAEFGYNKANEWHYVKDGDLPEDNKIVLFYTTYFDFWIGGIEPKNDKKHRWEVIPSVSGDYYAEDEVIAWKEIVLPNI